MSKFSKKKSFKMSFVSTLAVVEIVSLLTTGVIGNVIANNYIEDNSSYNSDDVINDITIFGGDLRYIDHNFNAFLFDKNPIVSHLEQKDSPYVIGYSSMLSENDKAQFNYVINYYNQLFSVINPAYKFEAKECEKSECDIFVEYDLLPQEVNANVTTKRHIINSSAVKSAIIRINNAKEMDNATKRIAFAHEMMHILYGSKDVNYMDSKTFSVYNYNDATFMAQTIENSKEPPYASLKDKPHYVTKEKKDSFISLTPTDVGTLIAIYGDTSNPQKKCEYIKLLEKTLFECSKVYGEFQPYFEKEYELPDCEVCK